MNTTISTLIRYKLILIPSAFSLYSLSVVSGIAQTSDTGVMAELKKMKDNGTAADDSTSSFILGKNAKTTPSIMSDDKDGSKIYYNGLGNTLIGVDTVSDSSYNTVIGYSAKAEKVGSSAIGAGSEANGKSSSAFGVGSQAAKNFSTSLGGASQADGERSTSVGFGSQSTGKNSVAIGALSIAARENEVNFGIWGRYENSSDTKQVATRTLSGVSDGVNDDDAVNKKQLDNAETVAITTANAHTNFRMKRALEYGSNTTNTDSGSFSLGKSAQSTGASSTSIGTHSQSKGQSSTALGMLSQASGDYSSATGSDARATGMYSATYGVGSRANGEYSVGLGAKSRATRDNEVNIGIWEAQVENNGEDSEVSYTYKQTGTRTISGVSDGVNYDDAVNVKQLDSVENWAQQYTQSVGKATLKAANQYTDNAKLKVNETVLENANTYTDGKAAQTLKSANENTERRATQAENKSVARSNAYTDNRLGSLKQQVDSNKKQANAGIAGVAAMANIPQVSPGSRLSIGAGLGNYGGEQGLAVGVSARINSRVVTKASVSATSQHKFVSGVGVSYEW